MEGKVGEEEEKSEKLRLSGKWKKVGKWESGKLMSERVPGRTLRANEPQERGKESAKRIKWHQGGHSDLSNSHIVCPLSLSV